MYIVLQCGLLITVILLKKLQACHGHFFKACFSQLVVYKCLKKKQGSAGCKTSASSTQKQQPFYGPLSGSTRVSRYQKKHSPTHHPDHHPIFISFFHLPRSTASFLFKLHAWQSFCTTSIHVLFGLSLGLEPSNSSIYPLGRGPAYSGPIR